MPFVLSSLVKLNLSQPLHIDVSNELFIYLFILQDNIYSQRLWCQLLVFTQKMSSKLNAMVVPSAVGLMDNNLKCLGGRGQRKTELFIFNPFTAS